ncbi:MAG: hypothetical protein VW338_04685 [Rhodospirillaceae bacterium]
MQKVNQPSAWPTHKLSAAMVTVAVMQLIAPWLEQLAGLHWSLAGLKGDAVQALISVGAGFLVGYLVKDRPNVEPAP